MKKGIVCMILAAFMLTGCKDKVNYIEQGTQQMEEQQYEEAVSSFQKSLEEKEDAAEAYRGLGMAYYEQQDYEAAKEAFQNVLDNEGDETPTLYNFIGVCSMQLNDVEGALDAFQKGIALSGETDGKKDEDAPDYTEVVREMKYNEIACYERQQDWETAGAKAEEYLAAYPDDKDMQKEAEFLRTR